MQMLSEKLVNLAEMLYQNVPSIEFKAWVTGRENFKYAPNQNKFGGLSIVDPFKGKEPLLIDRDLFKGGDVSIRLLPTILLDSNVAGMLNLYCRGKLESVSMQAIDQFLSLVAEVSLKKNTTVYDLNFSFYLLESLSKGAPDDVLIENLESLVTIQNMDYNHYLNTKEVVFKDSEKTHYGQKNIREIAIEVLEDFKAINFEKYEEIVKLSYLNLLKLLDVYLVSQSKQLDKKETLMLYLDYFQKELGAISVRDFSIAVIYFYSDLFRKLIPFEKKDVDKTFAMTKNTSWDFVLSVMPDFLLHLGSRSEAAIIYIATFEKELAQYLNMLELRAVVSHSGKFSAFIETDFSSLENAEEIIALKNEFDFNDMDKFLERQSVKESFKNKNMDVLISEAEQSIRSKWNR